MALSQRFPSEVSLKFIEEQPQILRLTTPELHPKEQKTALWGPRNRKTFGAPFAQNDSQFCDAYFGLRTLALGHAASEFLQLFLVFAARAGALCFGSGLLAGGSFHFLAFQLVFNLGGICHV